MPDVESLLRSGIPHQVAEQPNEVTYAREGHGGWAWRGLISFGHLGKNTKRFVIKVKRK